MLMSAPTPKLPKASAKTCWPGGGSEWVSGFHQLLMPIRAIQQFEFVFELHGFLLENEGSQPMEHT
jgi:hypothetical protein